MSLTVTPANAVEWDDLAAVFGTRGSGARCFCQRYKLAPGEAFSTFPAEERAERLREQTGCGEPGAGSTTGLVAYLGSEPVGWCAVEPRPAYSGLLRGGRIHWAGRDDEDRSDSRVWAVTCFLTRAGFRKQGIAQELLHAAVENARGSGAVALEGYPITTKAVIDEELHVGTEAMFVDAGFRQLSAPSPRRLVMRLDF